MSDVKAISLADMLSARREGSAKIGYGYPPGWEAEAEFLIARQARARVEYVEGLAKPKTVSEFINLADECLKDLGAIAKGYSDKVSAENKVWLANLDEARRLIDGEIRDTDNRNESNEDEGPGGGDPGGGGPNRRRPRRPKDPWWQKLLETMVAFSKRLATVAKAIAEEAYDLFKAAVASAWSSFWKGIGEATVTLILTYFSGVNPF